MSKESTNKNERNIVLLFHIKYETIKLDKYSFIVSY